MICISVLFPAPFSPITAWMLSCCTSKATSCSAWTPGKRFEIPFILRIEGIGEGVAKKESGVRSQESGVRSQESESGVRSQESILLKNPLGRKILNFLGIKSPCLYHKNPST